MYHASFYSILTSLIHTSFHKPCKTNICQRSCIFLQYPYRPNSCIFLQCPYKPNSCLFLQYPYRPSSYIFQQCPYKLKFIHLSTVSLHAYYIHTAFYTVLTCLFYASFYRALSSLMLSYAIVIVCIINLMTSDPVLVHCDNMHLCASRTLSHIYH